MYALSIAMIPAAKLSLISCALFARSIAFCALPAANSASAICLAFSDETRLTSLLIASLIVVSSCVIESLAFCFWVSNSVPLRC